MKEAVVKEEPVKVVSRGESAREQKRKKIGEILLEGEFITKNVLDIINHVKKAILDMGDIAKNEGIKLAVVIFPGSSIEVKDFKENYPYRPLHELVKSIKSDNIIVIEAIEEFNRLGMTPQSVSINYIYNESHKNAFALKVMANYIYHRLKNDKIAF